MKIQVLATATLALLWGGYEEATAFSPSTLTTRTTTSTSISHSVRRSRIIDPSPPRIITTTTFATVEEDIEKQDKDKTAAKFQLDDSSSEQSELLGEPIPYSELTIGVLKETFKGENRVSQTPDSIRSLIKDGFTVIVEAGGTFFFNGFLM